MQKVYLPTSFTKLNENCGLPDFFLQITRFVIMVIRPDYQKFCLRSTPGSGQSNILRAQINMTIGRGHLEIFKKKVNLFVYHYFEISHNTSCGGMQYLKNEPLTNILCQIEPEL